MASATSRLVKPWEWRRDQHVAQHDETGARPSGCAIKGNINQHGLDVDHCFPWSAWPCDDLWNLMPAHRDVNQREKRDRLPSDPLLHAAREQIVTWWQAAYTAAPVLADRFALEAAASLPGLQGPASLNDIFSAASLQRMRLRHDQQVPEWSGPRR